MKEKNSTIHIIKISERKHYVFFVTKYIEVGQLNHLLLTLVTKVPTNSEFDASIHLNDLPDEEEDIYVLKIFYLI